jgi:hypothetical protein
MPELDTVEKLSSFSAVICCDKPNTKLYEFSGKILYDDKE